MNKSAVIIPLTRGSKARFKDGQLGTIKAVFTSNQGPVYLFESATGAVFCCNHNEVRKDRS